MPSEPRATSSRRDGTVRLRRWLLAHTGKQFGLDPANQVGIWVRSIVPQFFGGADNPDVLAAMFTRADLRLVEDASHWLQ